MDFVYRFVLCIALCSFAGRAESADWKTWTEAEDYVAQEVTKKGATRFLMKDEVTPIQLVKIIDNLTVK